MRKWLGILFLLLPALLPAQQENLDSLWGVWNDESQTDTSRLKAIHKYTWDGYLFTKPDSAFYFAQMEIEFAEQKGQLTYVINALNMQGISYAIRGNHTNAIKYFTKSLEIAEDINDKYQIAASLNNIGNTYQDVGKLTNAINFHTKSLKIRQEIGDKKGIAGSLNNIGNILQNKGDYVNAIEFFTKSLKLKEEMGLKHGVANSLSSIGNAQQEMGNYDSAIDYYKKSFVIQEEISDKQGMGTSLNNIGVVYKSQSNYIYAIDYFKRSLEIYEEIGSKHGVAGSLNNLGSIYDAQGEYSIAIGYLTDCLNISEEIGDKKGISIALINIGNLYKNQGNYTKAIDYSKKALYAAQEVGSVVQIEKSAKVLFEVYKNMRKHKDALKMYELYIQMRDSIQSEANHKAVIRQQYKYEYEKQAAADSVKAAEATKVKDAQLTAQRAENAQQQQQAYYLYGGLALALLFGGFIFNRFRVTNKQKKVIQHQKTEVEKQREFADEQRKLAEEQKEVVEEKNKEIIDSINYAKRLQEAILPPQRLVKEYLQQSFILYKPKDIVAGDFYWMENLPPTPSQGGGDDDEGAIYFAAADCTGHGVPGAMVSVICSNALSKALVEENITDVGKLLDRTRELVIERFGRSEENIQDGMDIALCKLSLPPKGGAGGGQLEYAGANNPLWIIRKGAIEVEETKADKQPIGKYDAEKPFTTQTVKLNQGDSIYIFSDGYPDQFGGDKGKKYKTGAMKRHLLSIQDKDMATQHQLLNQEFENWKGDLEQIDDVCVIGVRV